MTARARLTFEPEATAIEPVQRLLWDTAIRVEEGEVGLRERDLRAAEQALRDALARNAPDPELQRLIDEMQAALDRFLDAMMQQALQNPQKAERIPRDRNVQTVDRRDLQRMLDKARDLARRGQREQAQALLNQLQQMLENMRAGVMDDSDQDMADGDNEMNQAMQGLQDMAKRQRDLMDRSFRQQNRNQQRAQQRQGEGDQRARGRADAQRQQGPGRDPFGRPMPNATGVDTGDVAIPDEGQMERAREIYDELRRRAADPSRPNLERDYIDRLMKRF